jgi:hypothetical protein
MKQRLRLHRKMNIYRRDSFGNPPAFWLVGFFVLPRLLPVHSRLKNQNL